MHLGVLTCAPDTPMRSVAALMAEHRVHAVVVDGVRRRPDGTERQVWGIVSDLDLVSRIDAAGARTAGDLSATPVVVVDPREPLAEATRLMHDYDVHHLVVVEPVDRRPIGILSTLDVIAALAAEDV
jgi:CBS domain-containing protein